ncbi:TPM domain-containing protein [Neisseria perflava]|uniref:TPM domain-containing protein n=1 Tax=Neisseria perflava TaxID=33053 RepID=UPI0020A0F6E3|nr:TPM domain-containing protein [Neisseria perflava]MCP1660258.1 putative membrane protein [Neisseria perflava]MCP1773331.1 putative membrane protein [Neisseria perflava]
MEQNRFKRLWRHWQCPRWKVEKFFPTADLQRISQKIGASEQHHTGQIRFVVESRYPSGAVLGNVHPHTRALQWFGELGIWDTELNCGVLVYVSFADRMVEIISDRGINRQVPPGKWQEICDLIREEFRMERYVSGLEQGLSAVDKLLTQYYPRHVRMDAGDDLSNDVIVA